MSSSRNKPNHKTLQIKVIHINSQGEARQGNHHHIFGSFNSVGEAKEAAESDKELKCKNAYPR